MYVEEYDKLCIVEPKWRKHIPLLFLPNEKVWNSLPGDMTSHKYIENGRGKGLYQNKRCHLIKMCLKIRVGRVSPRTY